MQNCYSIANSWLRFVLQVTAVAMLLQCTLQARAQDESLEISDPPLIDQQPFDLITLKPSAGGGGFKVAPLPFRQVPPRPADTAKLEDLNKALSICDVAKIEKAAAAKPGAGN